MLARLLASGMLPGSCLGDEQTRVLRRLVSRRTQLVHQRTRAKNQIHAVLIRQLEGGAPERDLFAKRGGARLQGLELPDDERQTVDSCLREADFVSSEIALIDRQLAERALRSSETGG